MNHKRLSLLARVLDRVPREHFDLHGFADHLKVSPEKISAARHLTTCGTTACACGWAATIPSFRKAGLKITEWFSGDTGTISFHGNTSSAAVCAFFGLTWPQASRLFWADQYPKNKRRSPRAVAARIRAMLKEDRR